MPTKYVSVQQTGLLFKEYKELGSIVGDIQKDILKIVGMYLKGQVMLNITRRDYTQSDLTAMGHPYAKRHPSIQVHRDKPFIVHSQSGRMSSSLRGDMILDGDTRQANFRGAFSPWRYRLGFLYDREKYFKFVIQGTRIMHGRDTLWRTATTPKVADTMGTIATKEFLRRLKLKVNLTP